MKSSMTGFWSMPPTKCWAVWPARSLAAQVDTGDFVVVVNADKLRVTGNKAQDKMYYRHTGYPGGIYETNFLKLQQRHPQRVLQKAVRGMLPKGPLGYAMLSKLKVYGGATHPHSAQQPKPTDLLKA